MSVEWKDSYKIGHEVIDTQHQYLFELSNALMAAEGMRELRSLVMLLYKHAREHFELEEAVMREAGFPALQAHTDYHNNLLGRLNELSMDVGKGYMNKPAIAKLMTDWAVQHVTQTDAAIAPYLKPQPA